MSYDWRDDARCRHLDPDLFFPGKGEDAAEAKAVCRRCPVMGECLNYALAEREPMGIWGGATTQERERMLGKRVSIRPGGRTVYRAS